MPKAEHFVIYEQSEVHLDPVVERFNLEYPIGTPVIYWSGIHEGVGTEARIISKAEVMEDNTAVVWLEGVFEGMLSCVALTHIEPISIPLTRQGQEP